jgi:osmotically-inducible protein OsmY
MLRPSEEIKKDVTDQLYWDSRVDASDVTVAVDGGRVDLRGKVPSLSARQSAERDAWAVRGVTDVQNEVTVEFGEPIPSTEDAELHIRRMLEWNPDLRSQDIQVSVTNGLVTLDGTVDAFWKKLRAETVALEVLGVSGVENRLKVVPSQSIIDETIAENVGSALRRNISVDSRRIDIAVENGVVTLTGTVPTWNERNAAFESALFTEGVRDVQDFLTVSTEVV